MKTRERWVVGLMIVVVLFGALNLASHLRQKFRATRGETTGGTDTDQFVENAQARLEALKLTPAEQTVLNKTLADWPASPFLAPFERTRAVVAQPESIRFTGYLKVGDVAMAILNGREYRLGEKVSNTDFVVESIAANHVVLASQGGGRRLSITLNASGNTGEKP